MEYEKLDYHGFTRLEFQYKGHDATVVLPKEVKKNNPYLFKTEYFSAFPAFELDMLSRGFADVTVDGETRWCLESDTDLRGEFAEFLTAEFGFSQKCIPVGMSCGGLEAVYFAAKYPEKIAALYLDAPVMNFLSCPFSVGRNGGDMAEEFVKAKNMTLSECLSYRNHPMDKIPELIKNKIPLFLVCGDSDTVVPYHENGIHLTNAYNKTDIPFTLVLKKGCDHHPHGLEDNTPIIAFAEEFGRG